MGITAVLPSEIISVPALSILGNSTGSTGSAESLNGTQVRTILGLGTTDSPTFAGLTLSGNLLLSPTNTYDIGNGMLDPRTIRAATSVLTPLLNNTNAAALIIGNSTYGVTVPGAATFTGDISMSKTSAQGYIRAYATDGVKNVGMYANGTDGFLVSSAGALVLSSATSITISKDAYLSGGLYVTSNVTTNGGLRSSYDSINNGLGAGTLDLWSAAAAPTFISFNERTVANRGCFGFAAGSTILSYRAGATTMTDGTQVFTIGNTGNVTCAGITASGGATITGGGVTGTYGLKLGSVDNASTGAVWTSSVTPSSSNFMIAGDTNYTAINTPNGTLYFKIAGVEAATISKVAGVSHYEMTVDAFRSTAYAIFNYSDYNGGGTLNWSAACMNAVNTQYRTLFNKSDLGTIVTASTGIYGWNGSADITFSGTNDTGLARDAAGVVEINNGTRVASGGSYGGLKCSNITASGTVSYAQGLSTGTVTKSANYTTTADDYCVNVTANSIDITFETAVGCANREHEVINSGSGVVTLKTTSAQTISGNASGALTLAQWKSIRVKSDGANWLIMSQVT